MSQQELLQALGEAQRKHLDPASPPPMRGMAARGLVPLPPRDMVIVLAGFTYDADAKLVEAARGAIAKLPDKILGAALEADLPALALGVLAPALVAKDALLEKFVVSRVTPDSAVAFVADNASEHIAEIIANDQERCLRSEAIVRALKHNPSILRSSLDRLFDFLVRAGCIYGDMPEFADAMARLSPTEMEQAAERIDLPPQAQALLEDTEESASRAEEAEKALDGASEASPERIPMLKLVNSMTAAQKVALAVKGNKEARAILLRDTNRVIASAAIRNPRITEQEVTTAAQSRSVCDEVIRIIAASKEMTRTYNVKVALVVNPKTPMPTAMRFLTLLREADVRNVAKSKNVSSAVANQAKRMLQSKK